MDWNEILYVNEMVIYASDCIRVKGKVYYGKLHNLKEALVRPFQLVNALLTINLATGQDKKSVSI